MSYIEWFNAHASKHKKIVDKLVESGYSKEQIVEYFDFDNMVEYETDFCPLYKENKKCHDMDELNCYLCACPNFRFNDEGLGSYNGFKILSRCDINNGEKFVGKGVIHHDCSSCQVPHYKSYALKNFSADWREIMKNCKSEA
ncbi:MAG: hypothetical protein DRG78_07385 [Epsilonproteobacteria bacterium]|nr:MAG: hypothetical protein DRG78_07385 [Campylobacterota bacterium]